MLESLISVDILADAATDCKSEPRNSTEESNIGMPTLTDYSPHSRSFRDLSSNESQENTIEEPDDIR